MPTIPTPASSTIDATGKPTHRPEPISRSEHYANIPDAKIRTTAIPPVT